MKHSKKLKKPDRDGWVPVLVVVKESERAAWIASAQRKGMTTMEWVRDLLNRIARAE